MLRRLPLLSLYTRNSTNGWKSSWPRGTKSNRRTSPRSMPQSRKPTFPQLPQRLKSTKKREVGTGQASLTTEEEDASAASSSESIFVTQQRSEYRLLWNPRFANLRPQLDSLEVRSWHFVKRVVRMWVGQHFVRSAARHKRWHRAEGKARR